MGPSGSVALLNPALYSAGEGGSSEAAAAADAGQKGAAKY